MLQLQQPSSLLFSFLVAVTIAAGYYFKGITMASLLRQIVAGPRVKHQDTGLDLCYVTKDIIATSGPSQTYPQRAYRNPLDRLVAFLDAKHGENWAIWEFRAEGTGYPDEAVYGRIRHFPWPDHHPPPFGLVPLIVGGMKSWLSSSEEEKKRVVVVHCKAGKGRSGTMACSYLIAECGWTAEDALARFTERRMRPGFGAGVSIPSQLRWVSYVDRWTKGGKKPYIDREVEILEVHIWGLRNGVKVEVEGFAEEGKKIKVFHTFGKEERIVVEAGAPGGGGVVDFARDVTGFGNGVKGVDDTGEVCEEGDFEGVKQGTEEEDGKGVPARSSSLKGKGQRAADKVMRKLSTKKTATTTSTAPPPGLVGKDGRKSKTISMPDPTAAASSSSDASALPGKDELRSQSTASLQNAGTFTFADSSEPGGQAVIFKPAKPIRVPNSDINISVERRNKAPGNIGLTMVTAVAHVWFNVFFEGNGPEKYGKPDDSGVFDIDWDKMDGIKGSSQRGTRACDRLSVVWRVVGGASQRNEEEGTGPGIVINEPADADSVPQMQAADWKGANTEDPAANKHLGLRVEDPASASVSKASSVKSEDNGKEGEVEEDEVSLEGVKVSGPTGEEVLDDDVVVQAPVASGDQGVSAKPEVGDKTAKNGFSQKQ